MENIRPIIARNIVALRQAAGMTQLELSQRLNYSDKAVSKWERGESVPDVTVLLQIAELFSVSLDYLTSETHEEPAAAPVAHPEARIRLRNRGFITGIAVLLVWMIATLCFVILNISAGAMHYHWLAFVCAVPVSMVVWLVLNSIWFNRHRNYLIISLLMWSLLASVFLICLPFGYNVWLLFLLGVPGQVVILLWSHLRYRAE